jgi:pseudouridine synthase
MKKTSDTCGASVRLQKILADAGIASRRKAEEMIAAGRVTVNGQIAKNGDKANPALDTLYLDGKPVKPASELIYIMLHKPEGYVCTVSDPHNRPVVLDLLPKFPQRLYPVGRLDYDSSGLLLLTNDGRLTQALTHPRYGVKKIYMARVKAVPSPESLRAFTRGITVDGKRTAPCGIRMIKPTPEESLLRITIREGRNRQIRKMCAAIGHPVLFLKRVALGPLKLGDLARGKWRYLTQAEADGLKGCINMQNIMVD